MSVRLRLTRVGKKKQPHYRVVAADTRSPRDGRFIEIIGTYMPRSEPSAIKIDPSRALHWLRHGAQPSARVRKLLEVQGIWAVYRGDGDEAALLAADDDQNGNGDAPASDAGQPADAVPAADATARDAGSSGDGPAPDAGSSGDGPAPDAAPAPDAGSSGDGPAPDAAPAPDAGSSGDGPAPDAATDDEPVAPEAEILTPEATEAETGAEAAPGGSDADEASGGTAPAEEPADTSGENQETPA